MVKLALFCVIIVILFANDLDGKRSEIKTRSGQDKIEERSKNPHITIVDMNGISVKNLEIVLAMGSMYDNTLRDRVKQEIANVEAVYEYADCNPKPICLKRLDDNTEEPRQLKSGEEIKLYVVTKQGVVKKKGT